MRGGIHSLPIRLSVVVLRHRHNFTFICIVLYVMFLVCLSFLFTSSGSVITATSYQVLPPSYLYAVGFRFRIPVVEQTILTDTVRAVPLTFKAKGASSPVIS